MRSPPVTVVSRRLHHALRWLVPGALALLLAFAAASGAAPAPAFWQFVSGEPAPRDSPGFAYDSARGRAVLFGGRFRDESLNDTWEYDGAAWRAVPTAHAPSPRYAHGLAYDERRGRVVLFGGFDDRILNDTWEYDGRDWTQVSPAASPTPRVEFAVAYDSGRGRLVLFGGSNSGELNDTWEFDGRTWSRVTTAAAPPARRAHTLVYDSKRRVVVLFGGLTGVTRLDDTWEYDGTTWRRVDTPHRPPARYGHAMGYDTGRARAVVFGGSGTDTWEYDGADWAQVGTTAAPSGSYKPGLAYHVAAAQVVLFGGLVAGFRVSGQTWEFDGAAWVERTSSLPPRRAGHAMAYDSGRSRLVLFGGDSERGIANDTWEFDGADWRRVSTSTSPTGRFSHTMAYDARRGRVVLFGGLVPNASGQLGYSNETWEYDGTGWKRIATATAPSLRVGQGMAYDAARGVVVLFGGFDGQTFQYLDDTWEYDGTAWTQRRLRTSPSAGIYAAMTYDSSRRVVVAFGGFGGETWEYNSAGWKRIAVMTHPSGGGWLAFDPGRGVSVLSAGYDPSDLARSRFWEYDGVARTWTRVDTAALTIGRAAPIAHEAANARVVLFGGLRQLSGTLLFNETWVYGPVRAAG